MEDLLRSLRVSWESFSEVAPELLRNFLELEISRRNGSLGALWKFASEPSVLLRSCSREVCTAGHKASFCLVLVRFCG